MALIRSMVSKLVGSLVGPRSAGGTAVVNNVINGTDNVINGTDNVVATS